MIRTLAERYLDDVDAFMRRIVDEFLPTDGRFDFLVRYPLGWINEDGSPYNASVGKRIRPLLLLLCAEAVNGNWKNALPAAAAVELLHNFSLVHDDIQDDSEIRRGRPTVWKLWGRSNAINAGDAMFTLAYTALQQLAYEIEPSITLKVWDIFNKTNIDLTRGQHLDMRFEHEASVTIEAYISMITGKSATLVSACAEMGALIGSGDGALAAHFASFGLNLGLAFQIRDDILGIWGDPDVTGKSAATDILSRKKSLPVLYGLQHSQRLQQIYQHATLSHSDVAEAVEILAGVGADVYAEQTETTFYNRALHALTSSGVNGSAAEGLRSLAEALFARDR